VSELTATDVDCHVTLRLGVMLLQCRGGYHSLAKKNHAFALRKPGAPMSQMGHTRPSGHVGSMSGLPPKADLNASSRHVAQVPNADIAGITRLPRSARYSSDGLMAPCRINNGIPSDGDAEGANEGRGGPERHCCEMQCQQRCAKSRKAGNGVR